MCSGFDLDHWMEVVRDRRLPRSSGSELAKGGWLNLIIPE